MLCMCCKGGGHNGDGCDLSSTLCRYDLRKGVLPVRKYLFRSC